MLLSLSGLGLVLDLCIATVVSIFLEPFDISPGLVGAYGIGAGDLAFHMVLHVKMHAE